MKLTLTQEKILDESIYELGLPVRIINALETNAKVFSVKDLLALRPDQILALPNFGKATLNAIYAALSKFGFNKEGCSDSKTDTEYIARRKRIRDALGGTAADDWDTEIVFNGARSRQRRTRKPKIDANSKLSSKRKAI